MLTAQAPLIVYQTRADYRKLVPVGLDAEKTQIVSYPHPSDIRSDKGLRYPIDLGKGFLLDNQGIGTNVAFLDITYEEYSKMTDAPSLVAMYSKLKDRDPLVLMYNAGRHGDYSDPVKELKAWIKNDSLTQKAVRLK